MIATVITAITSAVVGIATIVGKAAEKEKEQSALELGNTNATIAGMHTTNLHHSNSNTGFVIVIVLIIIGMIALHYFNQKK